MGFFVGIPRPVIALTSIVGARVRRIGSVSTSNPLPPGDGNGVGEGGVSGMFVSGCDLAESRNVANIRSVNVFIVSVVVLYLSVWYECVDAPKSTDLEVRVVP